MSCYICIRYLQRFPRFYEHCSYKEPLLYPFSLPRQVSMVAKVVPSPDWFIGVDGLDLCRRSAWLDTHTVDLHPYDAGTDMGYTFTAPNWPETPPKPVIQITSQSPSHPANSFYYPDLPNLPPIGRLDFRKVRAFN